MDEARRYFSSFHAMATGDGELDDDLPASAKLQVLSGVREFPTRVKCATLAWHTARAAIDQQTDEVTTE